MMMVMMNKTEKYSTVYKKHTRAAVSSAQQQISCTSQVYK